MRWIGWLSLAFVASLVGCTDDAAFTLRVDLRTDYRPAIQFDSARVRILEAPAPSEVGREFQASADGSADYITGVRLGSFDDLGPGAYTIDVALERGGGRLASRTLAVRVDGNSTVNAVISVSCDELVCPSSSDPSDATACTGGRCVPPSCTPETPEACPMPVCMADADCAAAGACLEGRCVAGDCFQSPDDALCPADTYCDATGSCEPRPVSTDMGPMPVDMGSRDGGPSAPTLQLETPQPGGCIDLGMAYLSGEDFTLRRTITGPPGGTGSQLNSHTSCAGSPSFDDGETIVLDGAGRDVNTLYTGALDECWSLIYGQWEVRARIDGLVSAPVTVTYYNSTCPNVATCAAASSFCTPCVHACDEGSTEYCHAPSATCAPRPQLTIETPNGPGCVDLAEDHIDPPATNVIVTGRPGASSTQYNHQVSCAGATRDADEVRTLDGSGRVEDPLPTGATTDCGNTALGLWEVDVEVDGRRSNTVEVAYYNSGCPGVATCAQARSHCP